MSRSSLIEFSTSEPSESSPEITPKKTGHVEWSYDEENNVVKCELPREIYDFIEEFNRFLYEQSRKKND